MRRRVFALMFLCCWLPCVALAHPGNTDSKGGHHNRKTGEYHYHHGYPEHQHTNGKCPYDFDDKTGSRSGTSSSKKKISSPFILATVAPTAPPRTEADGQDRNNGVLAFSAGAGSVAAAFLGRSLYKKYKS